MRVARHRNLIGLASVRRAFNSMPVEPGAISVKWETIAVNGNKFLLAVNACKWERIPINRN